MHRLTRLSCPALLVLAATAPYSARAATLQVGPTRLYPKPCQAIASARPGDVIEIDAAGNYDGDVCGWSTSNLTIRGVNGRARIDAAGRNAQGKAIWVIAGNDTVVENIEFTGATVPDRNGAGIRQEGANLTVRNCYFHHNENGILGGSGSNSEILIEHSEFAYNGYGDGYSHNLYLNNVGKFTFRYNYSHHSKVGHLLKSRAAQNFILYNRFSDESGNGSYEVDLPNGGTSYIIGNVIEQGPNSGNSSIIAYREEGGTNLNPGTDLYVINNTIVNNRTSGGTFVLIQSPTPAVIRNNIFYGPGSVTNQSGATLAGNFSGDPRFVDRAGFDFRLQQGSPAIDAGVAPGTANGIALQPVSQYIHPACYEARTQIGQFDAGAYEFGGGSGSAVCAGSATQPPPPPPQATLSGLSLSASSVTGGTAVTAQVILTAAAPEGGALVTLSSSNPGVASVPAAVTVPAGSSTANFQVGTAQVSVSTSAGISATYAGVTRSATLVVQPPATQATLSSISVSPSSFTGGSTTTGNKVALSGPAPSGGVVVSLSSSNPAAAAVPATVTVPAGATSAGFSITSSAVSASTQVVLTAAANGVTRTATVTLVPASQLSLSGVSLSPTSVVGGTTTTANRVSLSAPAPAGGVVIRLSSSNRYLATVPYSVTVPAGATSAAFTIRTAWVRGWTSVRISAVLGSVTRSATLTIKPR